MSYFGFSIKLPAFNFKTLKFKKFKSINLFPCMSQIQEKKLKKNTKHSSHSYTFQIFIQIQRNSEDLICTGKQYGFWNVCASVMLSKVGPGTHKPVLYKCGILWKESSNLGKCSTLVYIKKMLECNSHIVLLIWKNLYVYSADVPV